MAPASPRPVGTLPRIRGDHAAHHLACGDERAEHVEHLGRHTNTLMAVGTMEPRAPPRRTSRSGCRQASARRVSAAMCGISRRLFPCRGVEARLLFVNIDADCRDLARRDEIGERAIGDAAARCSHQDTGLSSPRTARGHADRRGGLRQVNRDKSASAIWSPPWSRTA